MSGLLTLVPGVLGIWADTYAQFRGWPIHPSIYQKFHLKPIHLPKLCSQNQARCQILLWNLSIYQNLDAQTHPPTKMSHFLGGKWPTHLSVSAFQNPSFYTDHTYPWKYMSTPGTVVLANPHSWLSKFHSYLAWVTDPTQMVIEKDDLWAVTQATLILPDGHTLSNMIMIHVHEIDTELKA